MKAAKTQNLQFLESKNLQFSSSLKQLHNIFLPSFLQLFRGNDVMKAKSKTGIIQQENGLWAYRFTVKIQGKQYSQRRSKDASGKNLLTAAAAAAAREAAIKSLYLNLNAPKRIKRRTVDDVYKEYCEKGCSDKAFTTLKKQDSLWNIHIKSEFGKRYVDDITVAEIDDYLAELYYQEGYSYKYVEGFLKFFYLIFGQAHNRNYLNADDYNKLCVNKITKIKMPKMKSEDDTDIIVFSKEELQKLDTYFKGTNAETAYLLGRYCGLRINECFGLKWDHIDLEAGTIFIDRQMQCQNGVYKLVPPKTLNGKRTIYICDTLRNYLIQKKKQQFPEDVSPEETTILKEMRDQKQKLIPDLSGEKISSLDLVNCLYEGTIQTVNSMKYHTREIKRIYGIDFKYHYLRHTYGTLMAEMNTPQHLLCNQMGHGNINVTKLYYLAVSQSGIDILKNNINCL